MTEAAPSAATPEELAPLGRRLPRHASQATEDALLEAFLAYVEETGLTLYPAQEEAVLELFAGKSVVLNTPTGSGKSLVALAACFYALARGERAFFTAPIKALVSEKFFDLARLFGPSRVGMMTGDASINRDAPIICCTAEILASLALREGEAADVQSVVMDEFHFYGDRDRGVAWQVPLITLPQARFLLMSATLAEPERYVEQLTQLTGQPAALVRTRERPVPLDYEYRERPLLETIQELLSQGKAPVYIVHFSQRAASEEAQRLTSLDFLTKAEKQILRDELKGTRLDSPFGKELARFLPHGIGVHHAGMLPKYRRLVERLAARGLLRLICGTDTLGVGVNIPLRTVLFTQLCKFDGDKTTLLTVREFQQIAGRAGRRGFDTQGSVVVQAPEHVVENIRIRAKAAENPKKNKKLHLRKPPERGYVPWSGETLTRLSQGEPEPLVSRFRVSHGMLLSVLGRGQDGCQALKRLIASSHEPRVRQRAQGREAIALLRSLIDAHIVVLTPEGPRLAGDLQDDFSLNRALGLFAVEAIGALDPEDPNYALSLLSVVESVLEQPTQVLLRQVAVARERLLRELKAEGVEYEERLARLDQVTYPKPEADFIYGAYEVFRERYPWAVAHAVTPKSVVRDLYEQGETFNGYVKTYGLSRAEGVLLRYLSDAYRALNQMVPERYRTEAVDDVVLWLGAELRRVDASLLAEWEALSGERPLERAPEPPAERDITSDRRAFTALLQNAAWRLVQQLARQDYHAALSHLSDLAEAPSGEALDADGVRWTEERLAQALAPYFEAYGEIRTDPKARSPAHLVVQAQGSHWRARRALVDPEEDLAWALCLEVDLEASARAAQVVLRLTRVEEG
ncbi:MAG: DUF3516 domain-containing protein [Polyangiaceae bacterium]|nr:DUF3516 domain-containing protein [Polyangiaceae bacterium]MCW5791973.1 DUF3516 domain-containing protein [Polyangiaceae bacterium]